MFFEKLGNLGGVDQYETHEMSGWSSDDKDFAWPSIRPIL